MFADELPAHAARHAHALALDARSGLAPDLEDFGILAKFDADFLEDAIGIVLDDRKALFAEHLEARNFAHDVGQGGGAACRAGGVNGELSPDVRREIWQKFVFLAGLSGCTTTIRRPIGPIRTNPRTRALFLDVMREVVEVGRAHGVALPEHYAEVRLRLADEVSPEMTSSMHHDLERGNRLEVRWLAGAVVELGRQVGVPVPLNRAIADILELDADGRAG